MVSICGADRRIGKFYSHWCTLGRLVAALEMTHYGTSVITLKHMQITFTQHALARMTERDISRAEVLATLAQPLRTIDAQNGRLEARGG